MLRRGVLALVTALVVARPLVLGEDPGLLSTMSEPSGMVLTLLWLVAAAGWAVWRAWSGQGSWYGSAVEAALFAVVVLMFVSAGGVASYKHPAWLIAWEWLALLVAFCLVRQLAVTPAEQRGLLAAVLAGGVALSAYAVYQYHVDMPRLRALYLARPDEATRVRPEFGASVGAVAGVPFPASLPWVAWLQSTRKEMTPLEQMLAQRGLFLEDDDPQRDAWVRRVEMDHVYSRFSHPNSFAGYLVLLLPAAAGCAWASWRGRRPAWQTTLTAGCVALMAFALWLTHSRGAILGLFLASGVAVAWYGRRLLLAHKGWLAAGLVGLAVLAAGGYLALRSGRGSAAFGKEGGTASARLDYWAATWNIIAEHPWLGVGPGNFSRFYPRYMRPSAAEHVTDPHNFALEVWAIAGVFALIALLAALGAFFWRVVASLAREQGSGVGSQESVPGTEYSVPRTEYSAPRGERRPPPATHPSPPTPHPLHWEFYAGGMIGLLLGFLLNLTGKSPDEILLEGVEAAALSVVWFASFALFEGIFWSGPGRALVLAAGVAALLLNLLVSGGISFPAVATLLWVMAALALNALPETPLAWPGRHWLARIVPVPLLAVVCLVYHASFFQPVTRGASLARRALENARLYAQPRDVTEEKRPDFFLARDVLRPLERAAGVEDPGNAQLHLQAALWYAEAWKLHRQEADLIRRAIFHAVQVHGSVREREKYPGLDPESREGYLTGGRLQAMYADWLGYPSADEKQPLERARQRKHHYENAVELFREAVQRDPTEARLHYQLAEVLFLLEEATVELIRQAKPFLPDAVVTSLDMKAPAESRREALKVVYELKQAEADRVEAAREARRQAQKARELDEQATAKTRNLTDRQREQVQQWLERSGAQRPLP